MRVALVHDYLKEYGGAERVVEAFHDIYPDAPVYTSFVDYEGLGPHADRIKKWNIKTSWTNNWFMKKFHSPLRFLAPLIWESFDFSDYDVVISSSGWYISRGIITKPETLHICYLHHPPRHLYGYATAMEWQKHLLIRIYATIVNHFLRIYDFLASQRVDSFIANSEETKRRIKKFYRRDAEVIYPPVKMENGEWRMESGGKYYLCVSRLAKAKHIDLAIEACGNLGVPLKIVGKGRDEEHLKWKVESGKWKNTIEFLGEVKDEELEEIYTGAKALICPFEDEEFGIVAAEAMGRGVPVIALRSGGLPEVVVDGETGVLFDELTTDSLVSAIKKFDKLDKKTITPELCGKQAEKFSEEEFTSQIKEFVEKTYEQYKKEMDL